MEENIVKAKGFINKNGEKVQMIPSDHEHEISEITGLQSILDGKQDKVVGATAGNLATFDAGGNLQDSRKRITELAKVNHTHQISDVEGLAAAISPMDICLFKDSRVQEGPFIQPTDPQDLEYISAQEIDTVVECLKDIIRYVCAEEYPSLVANVYLRAKTYESYQEFDEDEDEDATMVHVYTTPKPSSSNVDFHIELLRTDAVWYTVVQNVHRTSDGKSITFEDATFAEFWDKTDAVPEKDLHEIYDKMSFTPKTLTIQTDEQQAQLDNRFVPNSAGTANLWLACSIGKCYKVKVVFEGREGDNYEVLCTAIASGTGSDSPVLKLYFGLYTLMLSGDGDFTAADLKNGQTSPSETGWDVTLYDNTTLFAGFQ